LTPTTRFFTFVIWRTPQVYTFLKCKTVKWLMTLIVMISAVGPYTSVVFWVKIIGIIYQNRCLLTNGLKYDHSNDDDKVCVRYCSLPCRIVNGVSSLFKYSELYFVYIDDEIILSHGTTPQALDLISLWYRFDVDVSYAFP